MFQDVSDKFLKFLSGILGVSWEYIVSVLGLSLGYPLGILGCLMGVLWCLLVVSYVSWVVSGLSCRVFGRHLGDGSDVSHGCL